jgi:hypothetical protein
MFGFETSIIYPLTLGIMMHDGYPPVERDEVYQDIFEQAENFKKNRIKT